MSNQCLYLKEPGRKIYGVALPSESDESEIEVNKFLGNNLL